VSYGVKLKVWGDLACFTRPEMKVERLSYEVMTPSAARGILEAIYWKPEIQWVVDRIHVLKPIRFTNIRRNEVSDKISVKNVREVMSGGRDTLCLLVEDSRQQRAATILRDVAYVIEAHFEVLGGQDGAAKHAEMFQRRAAKGQFFHRPYLGCREFPADFQLLEGEAPSSTLKGEQDLGYMLHDIAFDQDPATKTLKNATPRFFAAKLINGVMDVPPFKPEKEVCP
jgi:CRISPR-associated protein Cas5d